MTQKLPVTSTYSFSRFWELDAVRGVAVLAMVFYHWLWDVMYFGWAKVDLESMPLKVFGLLIPSVFLLVMGISLYLSFYRRQQTGTFAAQIWKAWWVRGTLVFGMGMVISLVTAVLIPDAPVWFGILHLIGVSIVLSYPVLQLKQPLWLLGAALIVIGWWFSSLTISQSSWFWLGLHTSTFASVDYFPLVPWFGVVVLGIQLGRTWYTDHQRQFMMIPVSQTWPVTALAKIGRHALIIYLIHQPVLWVCFWLLRH